MMMSPFAVAVDTREQLAYKFCDVRMDRRKTFVLVQKRTLATGDYSIVGLEERVCVERKSLEDLYGTLGNGRERFVRELERMQSFDVSLVVIEATWHQVMKPTDKDPCFYSQMNPASVIGSIVAFAHRFPRTQWKAAGDRQSAERETFRFLLEFWRGQEEGDK
jgi:ERCC4-type nuclease